MSPLLVTFLLLLGGAAPALAQPPPPGSDDGARSLNLLLPNYNGVAVGEIGSLEANAFVARADDSSAPWYNPAGLTLPTQSSVSGTAGMFQFTRVRPEGLDERGRSFQQIPSLVSFVATDPLGHSEWAIGFALARTHAWSQSVAAERTFEAGSANERVMVSSLASMSGWMANMAGGRQLGARTRVGASLDVQLTAIERDESVSEQFLNSGGLAARLMNGQASATIVHMRASLGVQHDVTTAFRIGALVRTPGARVYRSGSSSFESLTRTGATTTSESLFASGDVQYRLPLEFKVGAAFLGARGKLEVDLLTWAGAGSYDAFRSDGTVTTISDPGTGAPPSVRSVGYVSPVVDSRAVVNVAVGGQARLTSSGSWLVHAGYATDRSPVGPNDTYFAKLPLQVVTAGVSGRTGFFLGSVGLRYQAGTSAPVVWQRFQNGLPLTTRLKASSFGLLYSISLKF